MVCQSWSNGLRWPAQSPAFNLKDNRWDELELWLYPRPSYPTLGSDLTNALVAELGNPYVPKSRENKIWNGTKSAMGYATGICGSYEQVSKNMCPHVVAETKISVLQWPS